MAALNHRSFGDRGQRIGLRLITKVGSLPVLGNPDVRRTVETLLYRGSKSAYGAIEAMEAASRRPFPSRAGRGDPARTAASRPLREFDLTPSEDQELIRSAAARLADDVIRPAAARADAERSVPEAVRRAAAELGLPLIGVPSELGGIADERSAVTAALVLEELARGDLGIATALLGSGRRRDGARELRLECAAGDLPACLHQRERPGARRAGPHGAGTALRPPVAHHHGGQARERPRHQWRQVARRRRGRSRPAHHLGARRRGAAPRPRRGRYATGSPSRTTPPWASVPRAPAGSLSTTSSCLPTNLLGTTEDHLDAVRRARLAWSAAACGTAQAALDQLIPYVTTREAFGEPIAHRQAVAFTVADIAIELAGLRLVVWRAASRLDQGKDAARLIGHARQLTADACGADRLACGPAARRPRLRQGVRQRAVVPRPARRGRPRGRAARLRADIQATAPDRPSQLSGIRQGGLRHDQPRGAREVHPTAGPGARRSRTR